MTKMTGEIHEVVRLALERQRSEAEDKAAKFNRQATRYVVQGVDPGDGFRSTVEYWNNMLNETNTALEWLHGEFYNEWVG